MDLKHTPVLAELQERYIVEQVDTAAASAAAAVRAELEPTIAASGEAKRAAETAAADAREQLGEANRLHLVALEAKDDEIAEQKLTIDSQAARIRALEAQTPPVEPAPARPLFGACPITGQVSAAARDRVLTRWGKGVAVRLFQTPASTYAGVTVGPALGDAGVLLLSWKPPLGVPLDKARMRAVLAPLAPGTNVTLWHEADVKYRQTAKDDVAEARRELAQMMALQGEFFDFVNAEFPELVVVTIVAGWTFNPDKGFNPRDYINPAHCHKVGLDLDGLDGPFDFRPTVQTALTWFTATGIDRWTVAELQLRLTADFDTADRATWLTDIGEWLIGLDWPPEEIVLFESTAYPTTELTTTGERNAFDALIAG